MLGSIVGYGAFGKVFNVEKDEKKVYKVINISYKDYVKKEIEILKKISDNQYFCNLLNYFEKENNIYLKFPKYFCNLNQLKIVLKQNDILNISLQILEGLEYLVFIGVIHCDLKPENIMFETENYDKVRIIDFGSSIFKGDKRIYNNYIQTRWYCSPDVILGKPLSIDIDIWSLGCIIYELYLKKVLFSGGNSNKKYRILQLYKIIEILGIPSEEYLKDCKFKNIYFTDEKPLMEKENKYSLIKAYDINNNEIKINKRYLELEISNNEILKLLKLILRYENRLSIEGLKNEINDLFMIKKIKL